MTIESENVKQADVCKESIKLARTRHERFLTQRACKDEGIAAKISLAPADNISLALEPGFILPLFRNEKGLGHILKTLAISRVQAEYGSVEVHILYF
jgi:hypothetical protein